MPGDFDLKDNNVGTCCFCIPLKIGVLIIAILGIFFGFVHLGSGGTYFVASNTLWLLTGVLVFFAGIAYIIGCIFLLFGLIKRNDLFYKIYLIIAIVDVALDILSVILFVVAIILAAIKSLSIGSYITLIIWLVIFFLFIALKIYYIWVVNKARKLKDEL